MASSRARTDTQMRTAARPLGGAIALALGLTGCSGAASPPPSLSETSASSTIAQSSTTEAAAPGTHSPGQASSSSPASTPVASVASSETQPTADTTPAPWPGAAQVSYTEEESAAGALDRDETGLPVFPDAVTSHGDDAVTFKEWIALNPHPRVYQPSIDWIVEETVTTDHLAVPVAEGDVLRVLVICQDPEAEVTVGTWKVGTFTPSEHQPGCGRPADLPHVAEDGTLTLGYQARENTRTRLVVITQDSSYEEPQMPFADNGSPRFLPDGAEPQENRFAALPWRFMDSLPQDLFAPQGQGPSMEELLAVSPEPGVLDPASEQIAAEIAGVGVAGPEPGMDGEHPEGAVRLSLVCADPLSGPSSVGYHDPTTGTYIPLGWSDICGGYSVTLPRSEAETLSIAADVQEGSRYRLVKINETNRDQ